MMKTDAQLKDDVTTELDWDPAINASHIGVSAKDGVVTLSGHLDTYTEKYAIERAVGRVAGVKAIAMEIDVKLEPNHKRSDTEIAAAVESALKWHTQVPDEKIKVKVEKGWVTLKGEVDWDYQRRNAEAAVRPLTGVVGVSNGMTLKVAIAPSNVVGRIKDAFTRHAEREAKQIEVAVNGALVTLRGTVDSWAERTAAAGAAWSAPGITNVINEIRVQA
jgi:osmotically-inducible protein OsmY